MRTMLFLLFCFVASDAIAFDDDKAKPRIEGEYSLNEGKEDREIKRLVAIHMVEVVAVTENKRLLNSAIGKTTSDLFNYAQPSKTPDNNRFIAAAKEDRKIGLALANAKSNTPEYDNLYARRLELQAIKRINQPLETQESNDAKIVVFNKR